MEFMEIYRPQQNWKPKGGEEKMQEKPTYGGLCANCQYASECTFPRLPERPVRHCEEFKGIESGEGRHSAEGSYLLRSGFDSEEIDYRRKMGLCFNCAIRRTCSYPKPEGGVWHCEEYR